jgi:hypothetical protein
MGRFSQSFVARPWGNCGGVWQQSFTSLNMLLKY